MFFVQSVRAEPNGDNAHIVQTDPPRATRVDEKVRFICQIFRVSGKAVASFQIFWGN